MNNNNLTPNTKQIKYCSFSKSSIKHTKTTNSSLMRTVSKVVEVNSVGSTVMLGQFRWLKKGKASYDKKLTPSGSDKTHNKIDDISSMSSDIGNSSSSSISEVSAKIDRPPKNMKYVNILKKSSVIKNTLLGRMLNIKYIESIDFVDQHTLTKTMNFSEGFKIQTEKMLDEIDNSDSDQGWGDEENYEYNQFKSESSPIPKTNREIIDEFKKSSNLLSPTIKRDTSNKNPHHKINTRGAQIINGYQQEYPARSGELNAELQKMKSIERRSTPNIGNADELEQPKIQKIKKSSTNLKVASGDTLNSTKKPKFNFMARSKKIIKKSQKMNKSDANSIIYGKKNVKSREVYYRDFLLRLIINGELSKINDLLDGVALIQETILSKLFLLSFRSKR